MHIWTKKVTFLAIIFIFLTSIFSFQTKPKNLIRIIPAQNSEYKTVIFDLGGVLLTTDSKTKTWIIAKTILSNPSLIYRLINFDTKKEYFNFLHSLPAQSTQPMFIQNEQAPAIFVDWQTGIAKTDDIKTLIQNSLTTTNHPIAIKNLFLAIAELMFTPTLLANSQLPINNMVNILNKLKMAGYKLYALTNWDPESFPEVQQSHDFFAHFDGIMVSGYEKEGKPSHAFFKNLLNRYNIDPATTVFIDDEPKNVQASKECEIGHAICYKHTHDVIDQLIELGIATNDYE